LRLAAHATMVAAIRAVEQKRRCGFSRRRLQMPTEAYR
jgi:hypothetical protein